MSSLPSHARTVHHFDSFNLDHGLSQQSICCVLQDSAGYIWIGTQDGLNRFDGYHFKVFKHAAHDIHSITDNVIKSIYEDSDGYLWIGTFIGGLNRFDPKTERFSRYEFDKDSRNKLNRSSINALVQTQGTKLWIGITDYIGLLNVDKQTFSAIELPIDQKTGVGGHQVDSMSADENGNLWIATLGGGLYFYHVATKQFNHFIHDPNDPNSIADNNVQEVFHDANHQLWVGTNSGLSRFNRDTLSFEHFFHHPDDINTLSSNVITGIVEDRLNRLWIGTVDGLNLYDRRTQTFSRVIDDDTVNHLPSQVIRSLTVSKDDVLWVGTFAHGLSKHNIGAEVFNHIRQNKYNSQYPQYSIWRMIEGSDGNIWLATDGGGLMRYHNKSGLFDHFRFDPDDDNSLSSDRLYALEEDSPGVFWVGTIDSGLNRINVETGQVERFGYDTQGPDSVGDHIIMTIYKDSHDDVWIGTRNGLARFNRADGTFSHFQHDPQNPHSLAERGVTAIAEDGQQRLWVGTYGGGLNLFDPLTEQFSHLRHDENETNTLSSDSIMSIRATKDRTGLWVTGFGGLDRLNLNTLKVTRMITQDAIIYGVLETDNKELWYGSNQGIGQFNLHSKKRTIYDVADGLQGREFNYGAYFQSTKGELFFGGSNGFNRFYPSHVGKNLRPLTVTLTGMRVSNRPVVFDHDQSDRDPQSPFSLPMALAYVDRLNISVQQRLVAFEFSALNYVNPQRYEYQYKLENYNDEWVTTSHNIRMATFTNLPQGDYRLKVRAKRRGDPWSPVVTTLPIRVSGPWYFSWWAISFYCLFLVALVGGNAIQRYRQYRELHLSEERLSLALWGSNSELWDWDLTGKTMYRSTYKNADRLERRYSFDEQLLRQRVHAEDVERVIAEFYRHRVDQHDDFDVTYRVRNDNGQWHWHRRRGKVISRNSRGEAQRFVGTIEDVDELKQTQEKLAQLNEGLELIVANRTAELNETLAKLEALQDQLIESKKMASLAGVVAGVAHELNTPLGVLLTATSQLSCNVDGLVEKLNSQSLTRQYLSQFEQHHQTGFALLQSNINRSINLVQKFKALSLHAHEDRAVRFNLKDVLNQTIDCHKSALIRDHIKVALDCDGRLAITSYPTTLAEVFQQLFENTLLHAYPDHEGGTIAIEVIEYENQVQFIYSDDGVGLEPSRVKDLCDPFYTTKRSAECTGLGMAIVFNQVVQKMVGTLSYTTSSGEGLKVVIRIAKTIVEKPELAEARALG